MLVPGQDIYSWSYYFGGITKRLGKLESPVDFVCQIKFWFEIEFTLYLKPITVA